MTDKDRLVQVINNLNENGLKILVEIIGDMDKKERYNKNTSIERLLEIQQMNEEKEALEKEKHLANQKKSALERAREEYHRQKTFKTSLSGKEKKLFDLIENVKPGTRYQMVYWEVELLAELYDNSLVNGSYDIFRYGFLKGQRAEKNRRKRAEKNECND